MAGNQNKSGYTDKHFIGRLGNLHPMLGLGITSLCSLIKIWPSDLWLLFYAFDLSACNNSTLWTYNVGAYFFLLELQVTYMPYNFCCYV